VDASKRLELGQRIATKSQSGKVVRSEGAVVPSARILERVDYMSDADKLWVSQVEASDRHVSRRAMVQRLLTGAGVGMAWPVIAATHPIHKHFTNGTLLDSADNLAATNWKPIFLNAEQNKQLLALSESIVPGSTKAIVNRFIDLLLSVETSENRIHFSESLLALNEEAKKRFTHDFPALTTSQKNAFLTAVSTKPAEDDKADSELYQHFEHLKEWVSGAFYSSEIGMKELGWTGEFAFGKLPECEHPEGHGQI
jgi:gluconate 2-dehydrogenase subunit 3-like protein